MLNQQPYCCRNCPAYMDFGDRFIIRSDIDNKHRRGQCRMNPPSSEASKKWPEVHYLDLCGEHPSAPMTRKGQLLAQIVSRLESTDERAKRVMRMPSDRPL